MKIFFSVGEPSGDLHGANLIRQLHACNGSIQCVGLGGPRMAEAGCEVHYDMTRLAVMWFLHAVLKLHHFVAILYRADRYFARERPDAVVLIDFPGFNWWIARRARRHQIPVYYYGAPQLWAWAGWRIGKMRRLVDHVLCKLPFEETWYRERGCEATFVGHPYFDELEAQTLDRQFVERHAGDRPWVALLPGSRTQEVRSNLKWLLKSARFVKQRVPDVRFAIACFRSDHATLARRDVEASGLPVDVHVGRTAELIHLADCCMAVSGSVSLELLYHTKPTVIVYWISRLAYFAQGFFRKVKYITLVNLLTTDDLFPADIGSYDPRAADAEEVLMPEYLTCEDRSVDVASHVIEWLTDEAMRADRVAALAELKERIGHGGASRRAAELLLSLLRDKAGEPRVPRPHFRPAAPSPCTARRGNDKNHE